MEQIHRADYHLQGMFRPELASRAYGGSPVELDVGPIAQPHFLFKQPDDLARFTFRQQTGAFRLTETVEPRNGSYLAFG